MQKKKPKGNPTTLDPQKAEAFISGADHAAEEQPRKSSRAIKTTIQHPWESPNIRQDVTKTFNLRIPEPLFLKLKWLAENTPKTSMHKVCLDSIEGVVEHEVKAMIIKIAEAERYKK